MSNFGLNIGSRRSINVITPTFERDFVINKTLNHGIGPNITFTRASSATFFTSTGILSTVPNDVPRFDHDPVTLACNGLLIEESKTNFVPTNNIFNWLYNTANVSVSTGTGFAGLTSFIVTDISNSIRESAYINFLSPLLSGTSYTVSCYIKKDILSDNLFPLIRLRDTNDNYFGTFFNQASGTWQISQSGPDSGLTFITNVSTENLNTHYRHFFTILTPTTAQPYQIQIFGAHSTTPTVTGSIEVAGIQVEQDTYPTSYIPTAGVSATRLADDARVASINTASFYNQEQGTILMETQYLPYRFNSGSTPGLWSLDTGAFAQGYGLLYAGTSRRIQLYTRNLGNTITIVDTIPNTTPPVTRTAAVVMPTLRVLYYNGNLAGTNTVPYSLPAITTFRIGANYIAGNPPRNFFGGYIRKISYWPTRLSNNRLRTITLSA